MSVGLQDWVLADGVTVQGAPRLPHPQWWVIFGGVVSVMQQSWRNAIAIVERACLG
jgi:hypothetical protein